MAKPFLLSISLCLLLFNACLARRPQQSQFNECQLNSLNALEPDHRIESEAGLTESWNANHPELRCAGVAVVKRTIQPRGLHLPSYSNSPQLHFIIHGRGVLGTAIPGCAETFEKSQSQSRQGGKSQQDRHQKVRHFREGDIIAIPAGIPYWTYNNGDSPLVAITLLDTTNLENQLDRNPRRFYLAGNPEEEHPESQKGRQQHRGGHKHGQQQQGGNNVLSGFDPQMLAEAFKIDEETARKLQCQEDQRNQIVKVREGLSIISPHSQREEEEEQGQQTRQRHQREQGRHQRGQQEEEEEEEQDPQSQERHQREKGRREGQRRQRQEEEEQQEQERQRRRERGERSRKGRQQEEEEQEEEEEHQQGRQQRERGKGRRQGRGQEEEEEGEREEQETQARERYQREKGRREGQQRQRQEEEEEEEEEQREQERQRRRERAEGSRKGRRQEEEEEEEEEKEQQGRKQRERGKGRRQGRGKEEEEEEQGQGQGEEEEEEQEQQSQRQGQKGQSRRQGQRGQSEEEEEEEEGEKKQQQEQGCRPQRQRQTRCEQRCEAQRGEGSENALEETLCSLKLHQNIGNPSHADLYNPRAGRISTVNSLDLPILQLLQLSAERVVLYRNGIYAPHWNINANSIIYVTRGRGRVQVVNCQGNSVFNGELRMGQLLVVPQNFPVAKQAGSEGFEYIAFKTNGRAMISSLVGRTSVIRAIPAEVLANAFGIRQQQVSAIKYSRNEGVLVSPASQSQESYIV